MSQEIIKIEKIKMGNRPARIVVDAYFNDDSGRFSRTDICALPWNKKGRNPLSLEEVLINSPFELDDSDLRLLRRNLGKILRRNLGKR